MSSAFGKEGLGSAIGNKRESRQFIRVPYPFYQNHPAADGRPLYPFRSVEATAVPLSNKPRELAAQ